MVVPAAAEIGDIVLNFHWRKLEAVLVVRKAPDCPELSVVGNAPPQERWTSDRREVSHDPPSWSRAEITFNPIPNKMIIFLVPSNGREGFSCEPDIVIDG